MVGCSQICILWMMSGAGSFEVKERRGSRMGFRERDSTGLVLRDKDPPLPCPHCSGTLTHEILGM